MNTKTSNTKSPKTKSAKTKKFTAFPVPATVTAADEHERAPAETATLASARVDLAGLGLDRLAYVRQAVIDNVSVWAIHSAAGHAIGAAPTLEQAWGAIMQNDLQPLYVN